jgi:hypothetical protein
MNPFDNGHLIHHQDLTLEQEQIKSIFLINELDNLIYPLRT